MNSADSKHLLLADKLLALEVALRDANRWDYDEPSEQALQSLEAFCIDTMHFGQWVRFVMLPRFQQLIASRSRLPTQCHISPMAEEAFKGCDPHKLAVIVDKMDEIDRHLSNRHE